MASYGQFCPVAKAMEVLDERWTLLVIRELLAGSSHFNELRRGVPKMSPALLSKRLRSLQRAGLVDRRSEGGRVSYELTEAGKALQDVVVALGAWGTRWIGDLGEDDYAPHLLFWDMQRTVPVPVWPRERTVVAFEFDDVAAKAARWWLVVNGDQVEACDFDPGYDVAARVQTHLTSLVRIWRGELTWPDALATSSVTIDAPSRVRAQIPGWIGQGQLAGFALAHSSDGEMSQS